MDAKKLSYLPRIPRNGSRDQGQRVSCINAVATTDWDGRR